MRTRIMTFSITALALAGTLGLQAQTPQTQPPSPPSTSKPTSTDQRAGTTSGSDQVVTISGCLKAEKDVPGRTPSVADRAGMGEDYVLTDVKMGSGSSTAGIGLASMYEIKGISDSELKKHINHQVEVMGTLENKGTTGSMSGTSGAAASTSGAPSGTTPGSAAGTTGSASGKTGTTSSGSDLPDFKATSIKMVAATCSAQ